SAFLSSRIWISLSSAVAVTTKQSAVTTAAVASRGDRPVALKPETRDPRPETLCCFLRFTKYPQIVRRVGREPKGDGGAAEEALVGARHFRPGSVCLIGGESRVDREAIGSADRGDVADLAGLRPRRELDVIAHR